MRTALPLALLGVACSDGGNGTAVGNPGHLDVYVQEAPDGVQLSSALFRVAAIELVGCDRDVAILQLDVTFDALGPSPVEIPGGRWCSTVVLPSGEDSFLIEGIDRNGEPFMLGLSPDPFVLDGEYEIDGNQVLLTLSLAENVQEAIENDAAAAPADEQDGEPTFAGGAAVEPGLVVPGGLFLDETLDGRAEGDPQVASYTEVRGECGCASTAAPPAFVIALAGILGWRRRRERPSPPG